MTRKPSPFRSSIPVALLLALLSSACGRHRAAAPVPPFPPSPEISSPAVATTEVGYASWYGDPYHGRRAANGEVYDKNQMTAAHRTLPFETVVKVTSLENERSVAVRITDRGPFVKGRIIDLSLAAAQELAMVGPGTALVRLEVLSGRDFNGSQRYAVQVGAFRDRPAAEQLQRRLASRYGNAYVEDYPSDNGLFYRVRVGPKPSLPEAQQLASQLQSERLPTFVVRLDN
jgi:rare lipoprotein A